MEYKRLVDTKGLSKEDWVESRRNGIGGSDVASIAGINKWSTSYDVWQSKVNGIDKAFDEKSLERMYWGTVEEPLVCNRFTELTGIKLKKCNYVLQSIQYPFMYANVDRMCVIPGEQIGFEAKTTEVYNSEAWEDGNIPESYILQIQHYMAVTGYKSWYIAVKIGGGSFKYQKVDRDQEIIDYIITIEKNFWENHILTKIPPILTDTDTQAIKDLFKISNGITIPLNSSALELINQREFLKAQGKDIENQIEKVENGLKLMLGENEVGTAEDYLVSWKPQTRTTLNSAGIKEELPAVYEKYSNSTTFKKFDVKKAKKIK